MTFNQLVRSSNLLRPTKQNQGVRSFSVAFPLFQNTPKYPELNPFDCNLQSEKEVQKTCLFEPHLYCVSKPPQVAPKWDDLYAYRNQLCGTWQWVSCKYCGKPFLVKTKRIRRGEGKFCSISCGVSYNNKLRNPANSRSHIYSQSRAKYIEYFGEPVCEVCGKTPADVHHKNGDNTDNRKRNLQALCRGCHVGYHNHMRGLQKNNRVAQVGRI